MYRIVRSFAAAHHTRNASKSCELQYARNALLYCFGILINGFPCRSWFVDAFMNCHVLSHRWRAFGYINTCGMQRVRWDSQPTYSTTWCPCWTLINIAKYSMHSISKYTKLIIPPYNSIVSDGDFFRVGKMVFASFGFGNHRWKLITKMIFSRNN